MNPFYIQILRNAVNRVRMHQTTKHFVPTDPNPTTRSNNNEKNDCVIRALANAAGLTWLESFDILVANARETFCVPNDSANYEVVFAKRGYELHKTGTEGKALTVEDFAVFNPSGVYIIEAKGHLTAVVNGIIRDAFNPSEMEVKRYWKVK